MAEEGIHNILDVISDKCKIIFPSTHVVYEICDKVKNNIISIENIDDALINQHLYTQLMKNN